MESLLQGKKPLAPNVALLFPAAKRRLEARPPFLLRNPS